MSNMKLVTTETFGEVPCDFYRNMNDDILLTRNQIGTALEYSDPNTAITKIHSRHKDRLDQFSVSTKLVGTDGKEYETYLYTERGIMEICRWSSKPLANKFMDWCWDIVEKYRSTNGFQDQNILAFTNAINTLTSTISILNQDINNLKEQQKQQEIAAKKPEGNKKPSLFAKSMFPKYRAIEEYFGYSRKELYHKLYLTLQRAYEVDLDQLKDSYCMENGLSDCFLMDAIESRKDLRIKLQYIVNQILDKWGIDVEEDIDESFDIQ